MDLARRVYSRELKVAAMREIDRGRSRAEVARQLELSPSPLQIACACNAGAPADNAAIARPITHRERAPKIMAALIS